MSRTPGEWARFSGDRRREILHELLTELAGYREEPPDWYAWVTRGQPVLTVEQYQDAERAKRPARYRKRTC